MSGFDLKKMAIKIGIVLVVVLILFLFYTLFLRNINSGKKDKQSNNIYFENLTKVTAKESALYTKNPKIKKDAKIIDESSIEFVAPGDSVSYSFDIVNTSKHNFKLSSFKNGKVRCGTDEKNYKDCDAVVYKMIYTDSGKELKLNDDLKAGEKVNVTVQISYTKALDDSFKSSDDIIIELLDTSLTYSKK